ncbi:MAG: glutamine-hydrolyzing GMP synthase [Clostridium sp. SCN 57-10]|nr:MAG: glutamine-hydrolyzing GMP synthase [Clostridium sp. SCN 57-10]
MNKQSRVLVIDFGGQYNLLIARRVRECGVYCEILPYSAPLERIKAFAPDGIIFTGGPATVFEEGAPAIDPGVFELGVPVLGICYGVQLMVQMLGGACKHPDTREYGKTALTHNGKSALFAGIEATSICWMSHGVEVAQLGEGFEVTATTADCKFAAVENAQKRLYGVQFHPEVMHTVHGQEVLRNFLFGICGLEADWQMASYSVEAVNELRERVGGGKVLLALSGGVDSSVAAALMHRAVGNQLTCIFVDHGLLRKNEGDDVERVMRQKLDMHIIRIDARKRFLDRLAGVKDPEQKRKIIGEEFIRVFEDEAKKLGKVDFLVQGTIYPDVVESGVGGKSAVIKSHHNVGGLPDHVDFKEIIEPLRQLFKDEVRQLGIELGLPEDLVWRQPFPGPGLAVRVIGEITEEKLSILREADAIFREEIANAGLARDIGQYFAVLTDMRSVGVMGDERTYDYTLALRAVKTIDFMTADWARIPYDTLEAASNRIVNEVKHINRIVYDITSKPPATIEWE